MIKRIFDNVLIFTSLYFGLLVIDLNLMLFSDIELIRLATKPFLLLSLLIFYSYNEKDSSSNKFIFMILALSFFLLANTMTLFKMEPLVLMAGSIFFIVAKVFYVCRFSNNRDFRLLNALPFVGFYLIYMFLILHLTVENLGRSFIPVLLFLFVTLIAVQFAFLRKEEVNQRSYRLVIIGMFLLLAADTSAVLSAFYKRLPYQEVFTMLFYGISQYLIVLGLINEKKEKED